MLAHTVSSLCSYFPGLQRVIINRPDYLIHDRFICSIPMAAPVTLPTLPPEILEEIVDLHAQLDENVDHRCSMGRQWSSSMLALLSASRQLRLCVIRHIFRDIDVYCGDIGRPTNTLLQLLIPDSPTDLPLGSVAPNIKSLHIHLFDGSSHNPPYNIFADEFLQLLHYSLLDSIRNQSPLSTLIFEGFVARGVACPWDTLPPEFQRTVISFLRLPSLKSFELYGISGMKGEILKDVPLQKLSIRTSLEFRLFRKHAVNVSPNHHIVSLSISQSGIPEALSLPNIQQLSASLLPPNCIDALWAIITSTWKNLTSLEIDDTYYGAGKNL